MDNNTLIAVVLVAVLVAGTVLFAIRRNRSVSFETKMGKLKVDGPRAPPSAPPGARGRGIKAGGSVAILDHSGRFAEGENVDAKGDVRIEAGDSPSPKGQ